MIISTRYTGSSSVADLLGGHRYRTLTDPDRETTVFMRKMSAQKWRSCTRREVQCTYRSSI